MLAKLLKHDLLYTFKPLIIYSLCLLLSVVLTLLTRDQTIFFFQILHTIFNNCIFIFAINLIITVIMRCIARLKNNFYSDQGYLTHTLPIRIETLWLSKFINNFLAVTFTILVIALAFWLAFSAFDQHELIFLDFLAGLSFSESFAWIFRIILAFILQILFIVEAASLGIVSGYAKDSHRTAWAIVFGLLAYTIGSIILVAILAIYSTTHADFSIFTSNINPIDMPEILRQTLLLSSIGYSLLILATYFIGHKILQRGVNLD